MSGTRIGGQRTRDTNYARYGRNYYKHLGHLGGSKRVPKGFGVNRELARRAGAIGGRISRRGKTQSPVARTDHGAVTVYDRKRGLVASDRAA